MYEDFYRFQEKPFSLTPDPKFLYLSKQHQGALDHMLYGIKQREGFMVIMGDVGTGKTTLCRCLLDRLEKNIEVALILNPLLSDMDLLRACVHDLRVKPLYYQDAETSDAGQGEARSRQPESRLRVSGGPRPIQAKLGGAPVTENPVPGEPTNIQWIYKASKKELIDALNAFLLQRYEQGGSTVLIIDEAQNLSLEVLEQLRILSNLETEKEKLLQIIFVGQLELSAKLKLPELKQLNQRISIRYEITPLSKEEMKSYIHHRILVAGSASRISFGRASLNEIYNYSRGYPRLINLVCDRSLLAGYNAKEDEIGVSHVKQAIQSLQGEEEKSHLDKQYLKSKAFFIASVLFFVCGLAFFAFSGNRFFAPANENASPSAVKETISAPPPQQVSQPSSTETQNVSPAKPDEQSTVPVVTKPPEEEKKETEIPADKKKMVLEKVSEAATPPASAPAKMESKESYRIQIDSVGADALAVDAVAQLKKEGFNAYWKKVDSAGQLLYVVYVGPFEDINAAKIHLSALKQTGRNPILFSVSKSD